MPNKAVDTIPQGVAGYLLTAGGQPITTHLQNWYWYRPNKQEIRYDKINKKTNKQVYMLNPSCTKTRPEPRTVNQTHFLYILYASYSGHVFA